MRISIIKKKILTLLKSILIATVWVAIWQLVYVVVDSDVFVAQPIDVAKRIIQLGATSDFWITVFSSVGRISLGFLLGIVFGLFFAFVSTVKFFDNLFAPIKIIVRTTPVASFIMLAWLWLKRDSIPIFISALMVIPIVWGNVSAGLKNISKDYKEFAQVYGLSNAKKFKYIYFPGIMPHFASAVLTGAGLVWKAGVAAEVLCQPTHSIGADLFFAKTILDTRDMFAWTAVVIVISLILEKIIKIILKKVEKKFSTTGLS